jgi:splicing factor U2AF subunit
LPGAVPVHHTIVTGYDVEQLVDAALGKVPMPLAPQYFDAAGMPLTRIVPVGMGQPPKQNFHIGGTAAAATESHVALSRVLVLHNMVTDEDLATDQDYAELAQEVSEECAKFGTLRDIKIPRAAGADVEASAIRKVFLEYSSTGEAQAAEKELKGRQFGEATVETSYYSESDFAAGILK